MVEQYEQKQSQGKRSYASRQALFDLDGTPSVKTMHEAHDNASMDTSQGSTTKRAKPSIHPDEDKPSAADTEESAVQEDRGGKRSGHTPRSVGVREDVERDTESSEEESFDSANEASFTASVAAFETHRPGTAG